MKFGLLFKVILTTMPMTTLAIMARVSLYPQDDLITGVAVLFCKSCSLRVKHLRHPVNLCYPQLMTVPRVTIVTGMHMTFLK